MLQSRAARRYLRRLGWAIAIFAGAMALAIATVKLGGCLGAIGWSEIRCSRIPNGLGEAAMSFAFLGGVALFFGWWVLLLVVLLPTAILEYRHRRRKG